MLLPESDAMTGASAGVNAGGGCGDVSNDHNTSMFLPESDAITGASAGVAGGSGDVGKYHNTSMFLPESDAMILVGQIMHDLCHVHHAIEHIGFVTGSGGVEYLHIHLKPLSVNTPHDILLKASL